MRWISDLWVDFIVLGSRLVTLMCATPTPPVSLDSEGGGKRLSRSCAVAVYSRRRARESVRAALHTQRGCQHTLSFHMECVYIIYHMM